MKKTPLIQRLSYKFDNLMSKGTTALVGLLFLLTLFVVIIVAGFSVLFASSEVGSIGNSMWQSFMRVLDAGNVAGDYESGNPIFVLLMIVATVCGLFVTSILIGIINSAFEAKLSQLRKGNSHVLEKNHTLILGVDSHIFSVLSELIIANENEKKVVVVILSSLDKEELEAAISANIPDRKNTKIICRCGDPSNFADLENVSIDSAKSIIVLADNDFQTIKTVLAATTLLDRMQRPDSVFITAAINDKGSLDAAHIAGGKRLEVLYFEKTISRILAQSCRQSGLCHIYQELFDFDGDEIYMEKPGCLVGKNFEDVPISYEKSAVMGIRRCGKIMLLPPLDTEILEDDDIILIACDDGVTKPIATPAAIDFSLAVINGEKTQEKPERLLILGYSSLTNAIIDEIKVYACKGSKVVIASPSETLDTEILSDYGEIDVEVKKLNIFSRSVLCQILLEEFDYIIVLADETCIRADDPDAYVLMLLLQLRDILKDKKMVIVSEMKSTANQKLAACTDVNDFVIGSNLVSLVMTQVSKNRDLNVVFDELLTDEGVEIYLKPVGDFVKLGTPLNFYTTVGCVLRQNQIALGYTKGKDIHFNPAKSEMISFDAEDKLIIIAYD